jgi:lysophospholipase L1-like esterase
MKTKIITGTYVVLLHIILIYIFYNPFIIINQYWRFNLGYIKNNYLIEQIHQYYYAIDDNITENIPVLLLGDSHFHRMNIALINPKVVNFSVGSSTIKHIISMVNHLKSVEKAHNIVILGGINDLMQQDYLTIINDYKKLLEKLPANNQKFIITIPPVGKKFHRHLNSHIVLFNKELFKICHKQNNCTVIDFYSQLTDYKLDFLASEYDSGDNLHLNQKAYKILTDLINQHISYRP